MLIRFTRLTNDRHRFEIVRDDGSREAHELETRSTLAHDLTHYAVEVEGVLRHSFYGTLASGTRYADLVVEPPEGPEAGQTELVVAMLQGVFNAVDHGGHDPQALFSRIVAGFDALGRERPPWLTAELIGRILERLRSVRGRWRATPFHSTLELEFP
ncbi:MAG TPA: hypothetical protein VIN61_06540 [Gammaproteobacteria bacterium]